MDYILLYGAIVERCDPEEVIDVLDLTIEDLLNIDEIKLLILDNKEKFESYLED